MPVQQHVLNWLYSVLTSEYHDVNRTYNDVAHTITRHPSLAPRTDVHTFPNGSSALLLHLSGTVPVNFRGNTYRFPVSIWMPHAYPREPPLIYVRPTETMVIRPGQHIDPQGQVYHPYLVGWAQYWDKSSLQDFLTILIDIFAKEPPVVARQQARPPQDPNTAQSPPPSSNPPHAASSVVDGRSHQQAPPPPPKTAQGDGREGHQSISTARDHGPPLPPLPHDSPATSTQRASRYDSAPPLPPEAQHGGYNGTNSHSTSSSSPAPYAQSYNQAYGQSSRLPITQPSAFGHGSVGPSAGAPPVVHQRPHPTTARWQQQPPPPTPPSQTQGQWNTRGQQQDVRHQPPAATWTQRGQGMVSPPPDLLDEPLTLDLPDNSSIAPPPIPPNPEKDALLRQLAQTLASMRRQSRQQDESSLAGLQAQRSAMLSVIPALQSEMGQLTQLSNILSSNTNILHDALHKADGVIEGSRSHPAPDIDELLVAPTVVANQLYTLVAEERALGDAIFMLGRAVEKGRISPAVFAKMTRSLAREWYLKKALVRKIGVGMGLAAS